MFFQLCGVLFLFIVSENTLLASLIEDFNRRESPTKSFSTTDFLKQAIQQVEETAELGKDALRMLESQGETLAKVENCHDNKLVPSLNQADILLHNLSHGVKDLLFGQAKFSKKRSLRILEKNESYAYVKTYEFSKGWVWEERIIGIRQKSLILYGKIFQHNCATYVPLEKASIKKIRNSECNDRQFGLEVSYQNKKISFFFHNKETMLSWEDKLSTCISSQKTQHEKSFPQKKLPLTDGFTADDHKFLDEIHSSLDEILEISGQIGETATSQTRQIHRISGGIDHSIETIETQKKRLRKIHKKF